MYDAVVEPIVPEAPIKCMLRLTGQPIVSRHNPFHRNRIDRQDKAIHQIGVRSSGSGSVAFFRFIAIHDKRRQNIAANASNVDMRATSSCSTVGVLGQIDDTFFCQICFDRVLEPMFQAQLNLFSWLSHSRNWFGKVRQVQQTGDNCQESHHHQRTCHRWGTFTACSAESLRGLPKDHFGSAVPYRTPCKMPPIPNRNRRRCTPSPDCCSHVPESHLWPGIQQMGRILPEQTCQSM